MFARKIIRALIIAISISSRVPALPSPLQLSETVIMTKYIVKGCDSYFKKCVENTLKDRKKKH